MPGGEVTTASTFSHARSLNTTLGCEDAYTVLDAIVADASAATGVRMADIEARAFDVRTGAECTTTCYDNCTYCTDPTNISTCAEQTADGYCDDGGAGSFTSLCTSGTDCTDCGTRGRRLSTDVEGRRLSAAQTFISLIFWVVQSVGTTDSLNNAVTAFQATLDNATLAATLFPSATAIVPFTVTEVTPVISVTVSRTYAAIAPSPPPPAPRYPPPPPPPPPPPLPPPPLCHTTCFNDDNGEMLDGATTKMDMLCVQPGDLKNQCRPMYGKSACSSGYVCFNPVATEDARGCSDKKGKWRKKKCKKKASSGKCTKKKIRKKCKWSCDVC